MEPDQVFGALFQYPGVTGAFHDFSDVIARLHAARAIAVVAADPLALRDLDGPRDQPGVVSGEGVV